MSETNGKNSRDRSTDRRSNLSGHTHKTRQEHRSRSRDRDHDRERSRHEPRRSSRERSHRDRGGRDYDRSRHERSTRGYDDDAERDKHRNRDRERERDRDRDRHRDKDDRDRRDRDSGRDRERDRDRRRPREDDVEEDGGRERARRRRNEPERRRRSSPPGDLRSRNMDIDSNAPDVASRAKDRSSPKPPARPSPRPPIDDRDRSPGLDDPLDQPMNRRASPARRASPNYEAPSALVNDEPDNPEDDSEARSVFVSQLAARLTARDLGYFFEEHMGENSVRDCRIVTDRISRRSKGIAYVEFRTMDLVPKAIGLSGTVVMGLPIMIQLTEAERNRTHAADLAAAGGSSGPRGGAMQLYVGSLHFNLTEADIRQVFEPFGDLDFVDLHRDPLTGRSKGYAFVQYKRPEDAKMALEQMEGFELAGRALRVNTVHEKGSTVKIQQDSLEENGGANLNAASRQALMQKLARTDSAPSEPLEQIRPNIPSAMATRSILLRNMFDPEEETDADWDRDLADDVKRECEEKYGKVAALKVEPQSKGEIYIKFASVDYAVKAIASLNGRFFGGKQVSAAHISDAIMQAHQ